MVTPDVCWVSCKLILPVKRLMDIENFKQDEILKGGAAFQILSERRYAAMGKIASYLMTGWRLPATQEDGSQSLH